MKISSKKPRNYFSTFSLLLAITGCHNYYMAAPINKSYDIAKAIDSLKQGDKFFILRNGFFSYHMKDISLSDDSKAVKTTLETLPSFHQMYLNNGRKGKMMYKKNNTDDLKVFNEVHIYTSSDSNIITGKYVLQITDVKKIELIEKDKVKTSRSHTLGAVIAIGATVAIIFIGIEVIGALTFSFGG